jgi:two-component system LytT family response regulator
MKLRALIVDDEAPARRKLRSQLAGEGDVEIVGEAASGPEAVDAIRSLRPDLVFLDVQMPGMTGFDVIAAVGAEAMPAVVFVTAFDDFALEAFDVQAVDYLLKPYHPDRFKKALGRAVERVRRNENGASRLEKLLASVLPRPAAYSERLLLREGERIVFVSVAEIVRISADGNYVKVFTSSGAHHIRDTMAGIEARLDPGRFARIHRSDIVNVDFVKEIQPFFHGDSIAILKTGEQLRVSRRYHDRLLRLQGGSPGS